MSRKKIRGIIIAVSVFYLLVSVMALYMLKDSDSVLAEKNMAEVMFGKEEDTESVLQKETVTEQENEPDRILEKWTEQKSESVSVGSLKPNSTGIVLERGDQWTKIAALGKEGYCYNQYLDIKEVSKEEYDRQASLSGVQGGGVQNGTR